MWGPAAALGMLLALVGTVDGAAVLEPTWTRLEDPGGFDLAQGVALAADGGLVVTGTTEVGGDQDVVTLKLSPEGDRVWSDVYRESARDRAEAVAVGPGGAVYVVGAVSRVGGDDALVRKLDADGREAWTRFFDKGTSEAARAVVVASDGSVIIAGVSVSINGADGFVAKLASDGKERWSRPINLHYVDEAFGLAVAPGGDVLVSGRVVRDGALAGLVARYSAEGDLIWTRTLDGGFDARGVAPAPESGTFVSGTATGNDGTLDVVVARLDAKGDEEWRRVVKFGGMDDEGREAASDGSGNVLVTGFTESARGKAPFVVKLDADGDEVWRHVGDAAGLSGTGAVAVGADGSRIAIAGAAQREGANFDYLVATYDQGRPLAGFYPLGDLEAGAPLRFVDESEPGLSALASWEWSFGDGARSTERSPTHAYANGGVYTVTLAVRDAYSNLAVSTRTLVIEGELPTEALPGAVADGGSASTEGAPGQDTPAPGLVALVVAVTAAAIALRRR